ncbi:MAG TPA: VWA domain-containing protein [Pyrinomonadaceae bacterium]
MSTPRQLKVSLVACAAAAASLLHYAHAPAQDARPAAPPRALTVTVTDQKGSMVTGLGRESFTVLDGGRPSEIVSFASGDMPATVGVLLDASGSMSGRESGLARVRNALLRFFRNCHAADEFFLIAFNREPQLLLGMSNDPAAVLGALDRYGAARGGGPTALYDALYLALNQAARGRHQKRALLLVTDGQDNASRYTSQEVKRMLKESDVTVYAVHIFDPGDASALNYDGRLTLEGLAKLSGGRALFPSTVQELNSSLEAVADELRNQYVIGFAPAPAGKKDGWHEVRVRLDEVRDGGGRKLNTVLRTRAGFYDVPPARPR